MKQILIYILPLLICGCASPSLVLQMKQRGVTHHNTGRIVLTGSQADLGENITVDIREEFLIQEIWDSIYQSRPYDVWAASSYRQAIFYKNPDRDSVLTLLINVTDASHLDIDGQNPTRFRCPKLNGLVMKLLQTEYDKQKKANNKLNRTP